jgi:hypothetical protein
MHEIVVKQEATHGEKSRAEQPHIPQGAPAPDTGTRCLWGARRGATKRSGTWRGALLGVGRPGVSLEITVVSRSHRLYKTTIFESNIQ